MCYPSVQSDGHICRVTYPESARHFVVAEARQLTGGLVANYSFLCFFVCAWIKATSIILYEMNCSSMI